jgi:hypothetical protein
VPIASTKLGARKVAAATRSNEVQAWVTEWSQGLVSQARCGSWCKLRSAFQMLASKIVQGRAVRSPPISLPKSQ